ncbi:MAG: AAA family ATPase [Actinomycetota bacterium]|nr:AAA family ATPase [Actinomycetota bacterium]
MRTRAAAGGDPGGVDAGSNGRPVGPRRRVTVAVRNGSTRREEPQPSPDTGPLDLADEGSIVGRQAELARLRAVWDEARAGTLRLVLVAGDPGVGKTRLVSELMRVAHRQGATVVAGRCARAGAAPYGPFVEAIERVMATRSGAWVHAHVNAHGPGILRLFPDLAARIGDEVLDPQTNSRPHLLRALAAAIVDLDPRNPVLLVIEDLHWAQRSTVLLLQQLIEESTGAVLVVGTYRDAAIYPSHPLAAFLDQLPAEPRAERLVLAHLSAPAISTLLIDRAHVPAKAASALAVDLWRATEGDPLLLSEFLRDLLGSGALEEGTMRTDALHDVDIPQHVAELVLRRVARCQKATRRTLEVASVVGAAFGAEVVAILADKKASELRSALDEAVAQALIVRTDSSRGVYRFCHELFRDAIYESVPANRRVRLHDQLAEVLAHPERRQSVSPALLVHHLAAAAPVGECPEAVSYAQAAAQAARDVLAFEEAAGFYGQALAFLGPHGNPGIRAELLMALGEANFRADESARARQSYLQAAAVARAHQDGPRLGRAVLGLGEVLGIWGADARLIGLLEEAIALNPDDASLKAKLIARLAQARAAFDSPDQRKAQSDEAWELAWDSQDPETMGTVLRARHEALSAADDLEDRLEIDGELVAMATNAKDDELSLLTLGWRLVDLLEKGHLADADRDREGHAQLARRLGDRRHLRDAAVWAAMRALLAGDPEQAAAQVERGLALGQEIRDPDAASIYWLQQLEFLLEWGDEPELDALLEIWRNPVRSRDTDPGWRASLARLLARTGRLDEAADELDDLLEEECSNLPLDRDWLSTVATLGEVAAAVDDPRSDLLTKLLAPYARRFLVVGPGLVCRGPVARVLALLHASVGNIQEAERQFQAAMGAIDRMGSPALLARTRADFGRVLARHAGGKVQAQRARSLLGEAADQAEELHMVRLSEEIRVELERLTPAVLRRQAQARAAARS